MRRKTTEKKRGVHFRAFLLCSYVRPPLQPRSEPGAARLGGAEALLLTTAAKQLLSRQRARTAAAAVPYPARFHKTSRKKSLSSFAARPTVSVMARKIDRGEKSVHFRGSRPCSHVDLLERPPAPGRARLRPSRGHRGEDCRLHLLWERVESSFLTKKVTDFGRSNDR